MVKPGGTGNPRLAISARLAPLPPSRSRRPASPSALPSPKVNTHLPDFATATLPTGLAALFFSALRALADGAGLARTATDGFDFAAIFFGLATALAMTENNPQEMKRSAPYTTLRGPAQAAKPSSQAYRCSHFNRPRPI